MTGKIATSTLLTSLLVLVSVAHAVPPGSSPAGHWSGVQLFEEAQPAQQGPGTIACQIRENGAAASGTVLVRQGGRQVADGSCGSSLSLPAGTYEVILRLDGALDQPQQARQVRLAAGGSEQVSADFSTAVLEVRITAEGRRAAGMATITRNGERIGTLGSGVAGHVSAGTYDVVVRYRGQERRFDGVSLSRGQRRALSAAF